MNCCHISEFLELSLCPCSCCTFLLISLSSFLSLVFTLLVFTSSIFLCLTSMTRSNRDSHLWQLEQQLYNYLVISPYCASFKNSVFFVLQLVSELWSFPKHIIRPIFYTVSHINCKFCHPTKKSPDWVVFLQPNTTVLIFCNIFEENKSLYVATLVNSPLSISRTAEESESRV